MPPLTHGNRSEPIPTYGFLYTQLFTYVHTLCCRPRLPQTLLYVGSLSMPQLPDVLSSSAHPGLLGGWQGAGSWPASREPGQPACWGLPLVCPSCNCCPSPPGPSHSSRSSRDTTVAFTRHIPNGCTIAAPHSQKCCQFLKPS